MLNRRELLASGAALTLATPATPATGAADDDPWLGRWDLTLVTPERRHACWLEIRRDASGALRACMVGRWGRVRELPAVQVEAGVLRFVSPKAEEGRDDDMVFSAQLEGGALVGHTTGPDGRPWPWTAVRAPQLPRPPHVRWGRPINLFDGHSLAGWQPVAGSADTWSAAAGVLTSRGSGADLCTTARFRDFQLQLDFRCAPGANSGVYLRGRYEVQIEDDTEPEGPAERTGGVYGYLAPQPPAARVSGVWRRYDITLLGRWVSVRLDGVTRLRDQEIPGLTGGALDADEGAPGPLMLQGSEGGQVQFRRIVLTPVLG